MTRAIPKLKRMFREYGASVFDAELIGTWEDPEYAQALLKAFEGVDFNDHKEEIVTHFVQLDVAERAKRPVFGTDDTIEWTPNLFAEEDAKQAVIRLGNGERIKMYEASGLHWQSHLMEQQKAIHRASKSAMRTIRFLESPVGAILLNDPRIKTHDVMRQMGFWK